MKPRIVRISGMWYCALINAVPPFDIGMGYTPAAAYADWQQQSDSGCAISAAQSGESK